MLPIYYANSIILPKMSGGSSYPCLMGIEDDSGNLKADFVVKLFRRNYDQPSNATLKEFLGALLCRQFGLKSPNVALVFVSESLIADLMQHHGYKDIEEGYYFGCEYLRDNAVFLPNMHQSEADQSYLELLFAFDLLIQNVDRRADKTNLLVHKKELYLIDHERIFNWVEDPFHLIATGGHNPDNKHVAFDLLRKWNKQNPISFDEFGEYLRTLELGFIAELESFLMEQGIIQSILPTGLHYLQGKQAQISDFLRQLKLLLS